MWRLLLGTMGVKSLVQGLNAAATAGFEPRTVWSEVRRRNRLATAPPLWFQLKSFRSVLSDQPECCLFLQLAVIASAAFAEGPRFNFRSMSRALATFPLLPKLYFPFPFLSFSIFPCPFLFSSTLLEDRSQSTYEMAWWGHCSSTWSSRSMQHKNKANPSSSKYFEAPAKQFYICSSHFWLGVLLKG